MSMTSNRIVTSGGGAATTPPDPPLTRGTQSAPVGTFTTGPNTPSGNVVFPQQSLPQAAQMAAFQPPNRGQRAIVRAHVTLEGTQHQIPAMCYQSNQGQVIIYPFNKALMGTVWATQEEWCQLQCRLENVNPLVETLYLSQAADLPPEVINQLLIFFECHGGGASLNSDRFHRWGEKLKKVNSEITMVVTCPLCTKETEINWFQLSHLMNIAMGVKCSQLGDRCQLEAPSARPMIPTQITSIGGTPLTMGSVTGLTNPTPSPGNVTSGVIAGTMTQNAPPGLQSPPPPPAPSPQPVSQNPILTQQGVRYPNYPGLVGSTPQIWNLGTPGQGTSAGTPAPWRALDQMGNVIATSATPANAQIIPQIGQFANFAQTIGAINGNWQASQPSTASFPTAAASSQMAYSFIPQTGINQGTAGYGISGNPTATSTSPQPTPGFSAEATASAGAATTNQQGTWSTPQQQQSGGGRSRYPASSHTGLIIPTDEPVEIGERLHEDPDEDSFVLRNHEGTNMAHPASLVKGRILRKFREKPPTWEERVELQQMRTDGRLDNYTHKLSRKVADKSIPTFSSKGDTNDYVEWEAALLQHFYSHEYHNTALRFVLAEQTLISAASKWWVAHRALRSRIVLSWNQFRELIKMELVPEAALGTVSDTWSDLRYHGDLGLYFEKVRHLTQCSPIPPAETQLRASKPFGQVLVEKVRSTLAQRGLTSLPPPEWEQIVRSYVYEVENTPGFHSWAKGTLDPVFKQPKMRQATANYSTPTFLNGLEQEEEETSILRQVTAEDIEKGLPELEEEPQLTPDVPLGLEEEAWDTHVQVYSLKISNVITAPPVPTNKIGKGNRPCFVCGSGEHSWIKCSQKKKGKCAVCGSRDHYTRFCAQRYRPDPQLITKLAGQSGPNKSRFNNAAGETKAPNKSWNKMPPKPQMKTVQVVAEENLKDEEKEAQDAMEEIRPVASSVICPDLVDEMVPDRCLLRQACAFGEPEIALPTWLKKRLATTYPRERLGKAIVPLDDPHKLGQLYFPATIDGKQAKMLYDPGASHCFMDWQWAKENGIEMRACEESSLSLFQGTSVGAIKWFFYANHFNFGDASYVWKFLVIKPAPADVVMGLNFIMHHRPVLDFNTLFLYPTAPKLLGKEFRELRSVEGRADEEEKEQEWVSACDTVQSAHLNAAKVLQIGDFVPHWENDCLQMLSAKQESEEYPLVTPTANSVTAESEEERRQLQKFLQTLPPDLLSVVKKHEGVFAPPDREPPNRQVKHVIKLHPDAIPMKRGPYLLPQHKLEVMHSQISELADKGWIERSNSAWGAPILFVPKKNKELRMCVDYRDLNAVTVDDCFPLPRIDVLLHRAANAVFLTLVDLASGFHQIEVEGTSRPLTAFRLPEAVRGSALWQWKVMPFGLRNAPPTFQRAMTEALQGLEDFTIVYIDDILIFSHTREQHMEHLDRVFGALGAARYHVRLQKCDLVKQEVNFLGHRLTREGITTQQQKVDALRGWKTPFTTTRQVKSFLGGFAWYQVYLPHFATMAAPLFALTSAKKGFQWTRECELAVQQLKDSLQAAPVLARWSNELPTRVVTDASKVGVGAVLEQKHGERWRPVAYWSRKLRDPETRYSATDLEWLAVVLAVTRVWHWLLEGRHFTICSDHQALGRKLHKSTHDPPLNDRQARWIEALAPFSFHFEWIKGANNTLADALSRNPAEEAPQLHSITVVHALLAGLWKRLKYLIKEDEYYQELIAKASKRGQATIFGKDWWWMTREELSFQDNEIQNAVAVRGP